MKTFAKTIITVSILSTVLISHESQGSSPVSGSQASQGFYIGFNLGQASYDATLNDVAVLDDGSITSASLDDSDTSLRLTLGYQINPNFSVEGGYIDFGEITVNATSNGTGFLYAPGPVTFAVATDGLFFDLKGQLPLSEQFELFGKVGLLKWDAEATLSDSTGGLTESIDDNDTFFGIGGSFNVNNSLSFNLDYTLFKFEDLDVDVLSVGIQYGF